MIKQSHASIVKDEWMQEARKKVQMAIKATAHVDKEHAAGADAQP